MRHDTLRYVMIRYDDHQLELDEARREHTLRCVTIRSTGAMIIPGCTQTLHVPVVDTLIGSVMNTAVVFAPRPGQTAMLLMLKGVDEKRLLAEMPLGEALNHQMFGSA